MASILQGSSVAPHLLSLVGGQVATTDALLQEAQIPKPRNIIATFHYFKDPTDGSPPTPTYTDRPSTYEREPQSKQLTVHDVRGKEDQYTLDTTGFQFYKHESAEKEFVDDDKIKREYYPETEALLKEVTGASKIFIFDHTIRRQPLDSRINPKAAEPENQAQGAPTSTASDKPVTVPVPAALRGPVQRVHIDQSYAAAPERVTYHLPTQASTLLKGRFQIINVWRPIKTILKDPLGVIEASTVTEDELVPIKLIYPHRTGETLSVRPAGEHRKDGGHMWHYLFEQTPEEVTLIKCFDSKVDGRARRVPHSAFVDEEFADEVARESIEVRALVFHPDDTA